MSRLQNVLLAVSLVSGIGLAERVVDPFDRHAHDYVLEGPQRHSETFHVSSNWHEEDGPKHDDRVGDLLLVTSIVTGVGAIAVGVKTDQRPPEAATA